MVRRRMQTESSGIFRRQFPLVSGTSRSRPHVMPAALLPRWPDSYAYKHPDARLDCQSLIHWRLRSSCRRNRCRVARQAGQSVALPSLTPFDAVDGALANISGVTRHKLYENDTGSVDANGYRHTHFGHCRRWRCNHDCSDAGGKGQGWQPMAPPLSLYRTSGVIHTRHRFLARLTCRFCHITIRVFPGYTSLIGDQIKSAIATTLTR
jgi:hypothetical protein